MSLLQDERICRIHKAFLDAAEHCPHLRFVAVTACEEPESLVEEDRWPRITEASGISYTGLPRRSWLIVLDKAPGTLFTPLRTMWLGIDGKLWQGGFFNGGPRQEDLRSQRLQLENAIVVFERLADKAALHFGLLPSAPVGEPLLEPKRAHRWLEATLGVAAIMPENRFGLLVKEVPGDIFTASAMTVDAMADSSQTETPIVKPTPTAIDAAADGRSRVESAEPVDPIADALGGQPLTLYLFLRDRKHWTNYRTLEEQKNVWRNKEPGNYTIHRGLRRLREALNAVAGAPHLTIDDKAHRVRLNKSGPK